MALAALGSLPSEAFSQETLPEGARAKSVRIARTPTPPVIDGVLDEQAWQLAVQVDDLHEVQPTEYAPASERTTIYLMYDSDAIYIGARLHDRDASQITARILRQGEQVFGDDWFSVLLDPFHDRRSGYRFLTNPNGLRQEGLFQNISEEQWDWEGIWYTASTTDADGWTTEIAIPFKTLSFDPSNDTWGINFRRAIARRDERTGWVSRNRNSDPSTSGTVVGLTGLEQGVGLDIVPSLSVREHRPFDGTATTTDTEPSLDLFYKLTPSLTGALTINTDFSATDVDDRQVNLTRFGLFFPEKRDFFLQDADIFEFGGLEDNGRPFFSRRIGLSDDGEPIDLEVGGKITGRIGRFNIGALSVRQDAITGTTIPADNATVARASANLLEESSVGMILTEGNPGSSVDNSLTGVDFLYRNSRLSGGKLVEVNAWLQESDSEDLTGDQSAYGFRVAMPNNSGWRGGLRFTKLGEEFDPGLGFLNRPGVQTLEFETGYTHRPPEGLVRSLLGGFEAERTELLNGELQSQAVSYQLLELESRWGDELSLEHEAEQEQLDEAIRDLGGNRHSRRALLVRQHAHRARNRRPAQSLGQRRLSNRYILRRRPHRDLGRRQLAAIGTPAHVVRLRVQRHRSASGQLHRAPRRLQHRRRFLVEAELEYAHPIRQRFGAHGRQPAPALDSGSRTRSIPRAES